MIRKLSALIIAAIACLSAMIGCQRDNLESFNAPISPLQPIYIFSAGLQVGGALGGRAGADATCCAVAQTLLVGGEAGYIRAFLSVDEYDQLRNIVPLSRWTSPVFGMKLDGSVTQISADWISLWDGTIDATMQAAVDPSMNNYWTGSLQDGTSAPLGTCGQWADLAASGLEGAANTTGTTWMDNGGVACNGYDHLLCVGF